VVAEDRTFVIVGGGLAGGAAAGALRDRGFDGRLVLIGAETHPPYERPPLSKDYLRGETKAGDFQLRPADWYAEHEIDLRLGTRAEALDPAHRVVSLEGGERIGYDRLLLATGGRNRVFRVPGSDLEGVLQLRTIEDADRIKDETAGGARVAVVGAGFIGLEVAASLRSMGAAIEVIEVFGRPLERVLGTDIGAVFERIHRDHGVSFHMSEHVERLEGDGRVRRVITSEGTVVECDVAVIGVGIEPDAGLAADAGLEVDNGILVDEFGATRVPEVFAAGDVANRYHPRLGRRVRVEHFDNALKQGASVARAMLGEREAVDDVHWFWSNQYDHNLQYVGHAVAWDEIVLRGSLEQRSFVAFYVKDGIVEAVAGLDRGRDVRRARDLVRARRPVDAALLRDPEVDLKALAQDAAANVNVTDESAST
jgi:3-phenylpropionate/trans-cinnamate dioxygenase ferredoxin reductase subunit